MLSIQKLCQYLNSYIKQVEKIGLKLGLYKQSSKGFLGNATNNKTYRLNLHNFRVNIYVVSDKYHNIGRVREP